MSLPIDDTLAVLRDHITDSKVLQQIAKDLIAAEKEAKVANASHAPRTKTRLVALVRQDSGSTALGGAYIISVPDDDTTNSYSAEGLLNRLREAAKEHNEQPRKRRAKSQVKVTTWDQLFHAVKAKTFKASGSQIGVKAKGNAHELVLLTKGDIAP